MDITNVTDNDIVSLVSIICHHNIVRLIIGLHLIRKARAALKEKRWGKLHRRLLFHQDNAPAQTSSSHALAAMWNVGFELLPHPPYSPDLAPSKWRNSWKDANSPTTRTLSARQMAAWKTKINHSSTIEFELWRNAGPSAFQRKETMLKSDKIQCA